MAQFETVRAIRQDRMMLFAGIAAILCLAYVLFMHNLGAISLWDPDEPRQAIEAREMMARSDYVHPYLNGEPYLEKPPLYPWLIIIASKIQGELDELSSRIPSALAATVLLIITFLAGRGTAGQASGLLAAFILATNIQFMGNARESVMDMTFALFIGLTIYLGDVAVRSNKRLLFTFALLPSALAVFAKGPAGFILPVGVFFLFLVFEKKLKAFLVPMLLGSVLALALSSIWFIIAGKAYAGEFILHQNLVRYTKGFDHIESAFYYFPKLFFNFLPWSCLLPFSIYHAYKRRLWLPLIWFGFTFLFFEFSRSKRAVYLLPLYPSMALLVGIFLREKWETVMTGKWASLGVKVFAILITVCPILAIVASTVAPWRSMIKLGAGAQWTLPLALLALLGVAFLFSVIRKAPRKSVAALFAYLICLGFLFHSSYMPLKDNTSKSARRILGYLAADLDNLQPVYASGFSSPALIYYLGRPVKGVLQPDEITGNTTGVTVIVKDEYGLPERFSSRFSPVAWVRYEKDQYVIFVSRQ
jgi:4-amino-4-deoxy-L-arabinose transferase-like glycosyltransferase